MSRRNPHMHRRALFATGAAAALLAVSGVSAAGAPQRGGRIRLALSGARRDDTWLNGDGLFMQIARQGLMFDGLTELAADGTIRPDLATGWQAQRDGQIWHFDLRADVLFHDGKLLTANDVVASLNDIIAPIGMVRAIGQHRVEFDLSLPNKNLPLFLSDPQYIIRPAHRFADGIGTGLYRCRRFTPGQQLLAERVEDHYKNGTAGWFDEAELVSIPLEEVRTQALQEQLVDGADIESNCLMAGHPDIDVVPARHAVTHRLVLPATVGHQRPLDNLRAAERWWFA